MQLPMAYAVIIATPLVALASDILVGIIRASLPLDFAISFFLAYVLGFCLLWAMASQRQTEGLAHLRVILGFRVAAWLPRGLRYGAWLSNFQHKNLEP